MSVTNGKMEIEGFLEEHPSDWEEILSGEPYCLEIRRDCVMGMNLVLFKYSQISSDFSLRIVRECRGLVLEEGSWRRVAVPFFKFFNFSERFADRIDWSSAVVSEKMDGSLIKVSMTDSGILVGTNGTVDAFKCPIASFPGVSERSFGDLFVTGLEKCGISGLRGLSGLLERGRTYMFELVSPYTQVVVRWPSTGIWFLGSRDNLTLLERDFSEDPLGKSFPCPRTFPFSSLSDCLSLVSEMGDDQEGLVVRDGDFRRVKVKSEEYLRLHRLAGNGVLSVSRAVEIVRDGEVSEIVSYFPHFEAVLKSVSEGFSSLCSKMDSEWELFVSEGMVGRERKEQALWIGRCFSVKGYGFSRLDGKVSSAREWLSRQPVRNVSNLLGIADRDEDSNS